MRGIRISELKMRGTRGDIARLRSAVGDASAIMEKTAGVITAKGYGREHAEPLAAELKRGAAHLRALRFLTAPQRPAPTPRRRK